MNDETKAALESLRREMADGDPDWWKRERLIFNHIDGEPARLAAAREEQREACARFAVYRHDVYGWSESEQRSIENAVRAAPLDATPLADELRTLRARVAELEAQVEAQRASSQRHMNDRESYWLGQRTKWIAEHDRYAESCKWHADRAERAEAQVAAVRAWAKTALDHHEMYGEDESGAYALLRAMDEAAKEKL